MNCRMKFHTIKLILFLLFLGNLTAQEWKIEEDGLPAVPSFQTSVYDFAGVLSPDQKQYLEQKLIRYADSTSTQIVIATVPDLEGHDINLYAAEWAHKWGIGQKGKDNGIFILLAPDDRKVAISTGYGVEHLLTDALSRRIIDRYMIPHFRQGDYFGGLNAATDAVFRVLSGAYRNDDSDNEPIPAWVIMLFILFFILLLVTLSRHMDSPGGGYTIDRPGGPVIWTGGRPFGPGPFDDGFGGGFGGGFSGGFGGGGFGGGGASGSW